MSYTKGPPLVSVIIPTLNSESTIEKCLSSLKSQSYSNIEIIVVDAYSKDRTRHIAKRYNAKIILSSAEMSEARNIGLKHVNKKSCYVLFLDSDMELTPRVIEECVKIMEGSEDIGGIIIPEKTVGSSFWARVRSAERDSYVSTVVEAARFFRTDLVKKAGGYDAEVIFYEDYTLPLKIAKMGYRIDARISSPLLHHEEDFKLGKWLSKKFYYGKTLLIFMKKYSRGVYVRGNPVKRTLMLLRNKKLRCEPTVLLGVFLLKIMESFALLLGCLSTIRC